MRAIRTTLAIATLALMASFSAYAQPAKGEMSGTQPADAGAVKKDKPAPSTVDPKAAKSEATAARKAGASNDGECAPGQKADAGACKKPAADKSTTTRAEKKAEGAATAKEGAKTVKGEKP